MRSRHLPVGLPARSVRSTVARFSIFLAAARPINTMKPTSLRYSMQYKLIPLVAILAGFFGAAVLATAQQNFDRIEVQTQPVQGNVSMLIGAGGNVTVQMGPDGVLIVDTQFEPMAPKLL